MVCFFGENIENVSFTGNGKVIFNGGADDFYMDYDTWRAKENELKRPFGFLFRRCERILLQDLELYGSGFWMQQYLECRQLKINKVKIVNHANWNNDGLDINNCKDVIISDCIIYCSDDAICVKSTSNGLNENILITNCILRTHYNGFKIGTETMGGGVKNLVMSNCVISAPGYKNMHGSIVNGENDLGFAGIAVQCCDGATIENINISNIVIDSMRTPIFIRLEKRMRPCTPAILAAV
ncbi:MAG: hypothetical protein HC896_13390 [Bacteroidales bacterium]|nr:hypothetical protein [Bacteroidales bacterium]